MSEVSEALELLKLKSLGEGRYELPLPAGSQEGTHVVFGGQLMAQFIIAASAEAPDKYVKSMSTIFSRAGSYEAPIEVQVETFQNGRTFGAQTLTATQGERLLTKAITLMSADEPDLIAHDLDMPAGVSKPDDSEQAGGIVFPGAEARIATLSEESVNGAPVNAFWTRLPGFSGTLAESQAILSWATNGWIIELSMQPHKGTVDISQSHQSLSTGVINHTINFHREFDASAWLLVVQESPFSGKGRVFGRGAIYTEDGTLVATFEQNSMVKAITGRGAL